MDEYQYPASRQRRVSGVGIPNVANRVNKKGRGQIFTLLLLALVIQILGDWKNGALNYKGNPTKTKISGLFAGFHQKQVVAWITVWIMLTVLSDFDDTTTMATDFAWLILLGELLVKGPAALDNLQSFWAPPSIPLPNQNGKDPNGGT